jgi:hypothetical protein
MKGEVGINVFELNLFEGTKTARPVNIAGACPLPASKGVQKTFSFDLRQTEFPNIYVALIAGVNTKTTGSFKVTMVEFEGLEFLWDI